MNLRAKGIIASPGIAIGTAYVYKEEDTIIVDEKRQHSVEQEIARFKDAVIESRKEIEVIYAQTKATVNDEHAQIFEAHLQLLEDPSIIEETEKAIAHSNKSAAFALQAIRNEMVTLFTSMDDDYMRERSNDLLDVTNRVMQHLSGKSATPIQLLTKSILVAEDLTPSHTATLDPEKVLGIVTYAGGATSHTAILARSLGIPALVGIKIADEVHTGDLLIVDAQTGEVILKPEQAELSSYQEQLQQIKEKEAYDQELSTKEVILPSGEQVTMLANISSPNDVEKTIAHGADGIGLFRSEFLFMNASEAPNEEVQFQAYKSVLSAMNEKPVTIRTLDIGGDKSIPYLNLPKEENPFLGYRAIRICLQEKVLFQTQLRALLRASYYGKLKILIPLITSVEEILQTKEMLAQVESHLEEEGHKFGPYELGIMIETPASVFIAKELAAHCDFFSIGTNDLIQYLLVVDRMNENIAQYYNPLHPAVLTAIEQVIRVGREAGIEVSMCGEMASDTHATATLLELGLRSFSMSASSISKVKEAILKL
jgi:phosphoenolpyruvate-protein phosphotransferase (PTS system enzyme I)